MDIKNVPTELSFVEESKSYISLLANGLLNISGFGRSKRSPTENLVENANKLECEPPIWVSFDMIEGKRCLFQCYSNGFQIWDISKLENICELYSTHSVSAKRMMAIKASALSAFALKMPLVLLTLGSQATIFSLPLSIGVKFLSFGSEILNIQSSSKYFGIGILSQIFLYDNETLESVSTLQTYPSKEQPFSIGSRWIAFAGAVRIENVQKPTKGNLVKVAREVAKSAYQFGSLACNSAASLLDPNAPDEVSLPNAVEYDVSRASSPISETNAERIHIETVKNSPLSSFISSSVPSSAPNNFVPFIVNPDSVDNEVSGSVFIYDIKTNEYITQFYAHTHAIANLAFDQSGSLLATADIEARSFHIFRIISFPHKRTSGSFVAPQFLYTLRRGYTTAAIIDLVFSDDLRWLSATSARGTSHLYGILPHGGPVSHSTHTVPYYLSPMRDNKHREYQSLCRIKTGESFGRCVFLTPGGNRVDLALFTNGKLSIYSLKTHKVPQPINPPNEWNTLGLTHSRVRMWDVVWKKNWKETPFPTNTTQNNSEQTKPREINSPFPSSTSDTNISQDVNWMANVELTTHREIQKLWEYMNITFRVFAEPPTAQPDETTKTVLIEIASKKPILDVFGQLV